LETKVTKDEMFLLTKSLAIPLPIPPSLHNASSNYIASLSEFVRWLGRRAEEAGVEIYPGFAGSELVCDSQNEKVIGVATNDVGLNRQGVPKVKQTTLTSSIII
jgi:electron-transferring-flavoprotein dehydrogenase